MEPRFMRYNLSESEMNQDEDGTYLEVDEIVNWLESRLKCEVNLEYRIACINILNRIVGY